MPHIFDFVRIKAKLILISLIEHNPLLSYLTFETYYAY